MAYFYSALHTIIRIRVYDGDGNRVAKTVGGVTTRYLVDDLNPTGYAQIVEEVANGVVNREYTYGLQRISQNQVISGAWTPSFYGYDGGGSVRQLTNATAVVTDTYNYDAFGNLLNSSGTTPNNYRYRGEQYDPDLNLYYLRARYYSPATGRFMSKDPKMGKARVPATLHRYLYASGDPVNRMDPSGRSDIITYADIDAHSALTASRVANTFGCVSSLLFTSTSLLMANNLGIWDALGAGATAYGCVSLSFPTEAETELGEKLLKFKPVADYGTCGLALGQLVHDLNAYSTHSDVTAAQVELDGFSAVVGCVTTQLSTMFDEEALE